MKLKIDVVHGHGDATEERVLLTVLEDCNLNCYMVCDATYSRDGKISNKNRHSKWFVNKIVKKGERVSLHTRVGEDHDEKQGGVIWHHIYWNFKSPIWNDDGDGAVLVEISDWVTTKTR
ncbi:hypothetical protein [Pseudomonas fragi]|uniref:hypothetical protein n=1 Tax=Pseudomonas fragi TaxID=296 RepID=UPI0039184ED3